MRSTGGLGRSASRQQAHSSRDATVQCSRPQVTLPIVGMTTRRAGLLPVARALHNTPGPSSTTARATKTSDSAPAKPLSALHAELLEEIEERKRSQALLLSKLNNLTERAQSTAKKGGAARAPPRTQPQQIPQPPQAAAAAAPPAPPPPQPQVPQARPPAPQVSSGLAEALQLPKQPQTPAPVSQAPPVLPQRGQAPEVVQPPPVVPQQPPQLQQRTQAPPQPVQPPPQPQAPPQVQQPVAPPQPPVVEPIVRAGPPALEIEEPEVPIPEPIIAAPQPPIAKEPEPPLAGPNVMNVVMVGAECAPWSKTGGLGDVMQALPKGLRRRGHRMMVVVPKYGDYPEARNTGARAQFNNFNSSQEVTYWHAEVEDVDYVFVEHSCFRMNGGDLYSGSRQDLMFRCSLLCKAALEAVKHVPCNGTIYGEDNLMFMANDWHTALLPVYLQAHYRDWGQMTYARCVFIIHNMAHQGRGPFDETQNLEMSDEYKEMFRLYDPVGGEHMNIMKVGLQTAHQLVAVSRGYAWECLTPEGGWGLHEIMQDAEWKLKGIVNGMDYSEWNPETDVFLKEDGYANYSLETLEVGKARCKAALQKELGLPVNPNAPLLGFIGRLDYQKGIDLIRDNYDWLMSEGCQLIMLGSGREDLERDLREMEERNKDKCRGWVGFSVKMAHRITAGCDILLMPSRFEPCGLNQLYAMAYGTVPVVHAVGGLRDTVQPFSPFENKGTGWTFDCAEAHKMREATSEALFTYHKHNDSFMGCARRGMEQDLSWDNAAQQYEEIMVTAKYQW